MNNRTGSSTIIDLKKHSETGSYRIWYKESGQEWRPWLESYSLNGAMAKVRKLSLDDAKEGMSIEYEIRSVEDEELDAD